MRMYAFSMLSRAYGFCGFTQTEVEPYFIYLDVINVTFSETISLKNNPGRLPGIADLIKKLICFQIKLLQVLSC